MVDISDKVRSIGMRAIEILRATAVEYDRLKEKPCWIVLAEQRLEAEINVAEILKNGQAGSRLEFKSGTKTNPRQIVTTRVGGRCSELSSLWDMSRNSGAHVFSLSGNKSSVRFLVCTGEQVHVTNRNGASINRTHVCRHDHWNEGPAKKRDDKHASINAFILNMGSKK